MSYKEAAQSQRGTGSDLPVHILGLCAVDENEGSGSGDGGARLKDELRVVVSIAIESEHHSRDGQRTCVSAVDTW